MPKYYYVPLSKADGPMTPATTHPLIDRTRPAVLMTADNPWDKSMTGKFTTDGDLASELKRHGIEFELTNGKYNGTPEKSVIAYDMPIDLAHQLSKKYGQESFIHMDPKSGGAKFIYSNGEGYANPNHTDETPAHERSPKIPLEGSMHPESGTPELFDQAPEDYYTFIPSANKFIRLGFDFGSRNQSPHMKNEALARFQGENTMKSEYTVQEALGEIAKVLKKYEVELAELNKKETHSGQLPHTDKEERKIKHIAASYRERGESPEKSKAIAYATVNAQHKAESCAKCGKAECECKSMHKSMACKKCGSAMKAEKCAKCGDISRGKETQKNEAVSIFSKDGDKDAKGQDKIPEKTKKAPAKDDGSGGDVSKGKMTKAEEDVLMLMQLEEELAKGIFSGAAKKIAGAAAGLGLMASPAATAAPNQAQSVQTSPARNQARANFVKILANRGEEDPARNHNDTELKMMGFEPENFWSSVANTATNPMVHYMAVEPEVDYEKYNNVAPHDQHRMRYKFIQNVKRLKEEMPAAFGHWAKTAGLKTNKPMDILEASGIPKAPTFEEVPYGGEAGQKRRAMLNSAQSNLDTLSAKLHPTKKSEDDLKLMLGLELMFKAEKSKESSEESSEETSSPERSSHEETPASEESKKAKKSVDNIKAEVSPKTQKYMGHMTQGKGPSMEAAFDHAKDLSSKIPKAPEGSSGKWKIPEVPKQHKIPSFPKKP